MQDLFSVKGKVALVTGGSRGIGAMIARGFVEAGAKVYISARKEAEVATTAAELSKKGSCMRDSRRPLRPRPAAAGLADAIAARESALAHPGEQRRRQLGRAARRVPRLRLGSSVLALNVKGVFHLTRRLRPAAREGARSPATRRASSTSARSTGCSVPFLETYAYSASKAAVHHLTRVLARPAGAAPHHRERRRPRALREQDDGGRRSTASATRSSPAARSAASASPRTWPASRSISPRAPAPT